MAWKHVCCCNTCYIPVNEQMRLNETIKTTNNMKKIYLVDWRNNYGLDCVVIISDLTPEQVKQLAIEKANAWPDSVCVKEIYLDEKQEWQIIYPDNQS